MRTRFAIGLWLECFLPRRSPMRSAPGGPTVGCVTSFTVSPSEITGDSAHSAQGSVTGWVPQGLTKMMIEVSGSISYDCIGGGKFGGDQWGPGGCSVPATGPTSASLSIRFYGTNSGSTPVTGTISTWFYGMPGTPTFNQQLTLDPIPTPTEPVPNDPDSPSCCETMTPTGRNSGNGDGPPSGGQPINFANGNVWITQRDYSIPGLGGGSSLVRTWNSLWPLKQPVETSGVFGLNWRSNFEERIQTLTGGVVKYWKGNGSALFYQWNSLSNSYQLTAPLNDATLLSFDSISGNWTVALQDGSTKVFNNAAYLISIVDPNGNSTTVNVDSNNQNRIATVTDPAGRVLTFSYNNAQFPRLCTSIADSVGTVATYSYDASGRLTQVAYADGSQNNFSYDANNLILSVTDSQGKTLEAHTYDSQRRGLTSKRANNVDLVTVSYGSSSTLLSDSLGNQSTIPKFLAGQRYYTPSISGSGCHSCSFREPQQQMVLDSTGVYPYKVTDGAGRTSYLSYDTKGNLLSKSLQHGTVSVTSYDTWAYTYNAFSEVLTATDPLGHTTTNTYDSHGNLLSTTTPSPDGSSPGSTTAFTYYSNGTLNTITDPVGNVTTIAYYPTGLVQTITDTQQNVTTYQYDARGNRTAIIDPVNGTANPTTFTYDSMNRVTAITYPGATASVQFHYDYRGRRDYVIDQNGKQTSYAYDDADRLTSVTDAQSPTHGVTQYTYDTESNLTDIYDAKNNHTHFVYGLGWKLNSTTFPSGLSESYTINYNGVLTYKTDRKQQAISYTPDWQDRIYLKQYPDGSYVSYTYDNAGRLGYMTDPQGGATHYTYDTLNRLINIQDAQFQNYGFG